MSHAVDVTNKALSVVVKHPELAVDVRFIEEAAMLHDIGVFLTRAPHIACEGKYPYICHGYLGSELLAEEGYPKHGLVCERHTGTGLSLESIISRRLPFRIGYAAGESRGTDYLLCRQVFLSPDRREKSLKRIRMGLRRHDGIR